MDEETEALLKLQRLIAQQLTASNPSVASSQNSSQAAEFGIDDIDIARSRETLIRKRLSQTRHCLPRTARALEIDYERLFRIYAGSHHTNGPDAIKFDALSFAEWLGRSAIAHNVSKPITELAQWESIPYCDLHRKFLLRVFRFQWQVHTWDDLASSPIKARNSWCVLRWFGLKRIFSFPTRLL